jgi:hypothetical protein
MADTPSPPAGLTPTVYDLDPNHTGKRLVAIAAIVTGFVAGVILIPLLAREAGVMVGLRILAGVGGGVLLGAGLATAVEAFLRERWPSGRTLAVGPDEIVQRDANGAQIALRWDDVEVLSWAFVVARHQAWVRKGWYCAALQLKVDEKQVSPYAFLSPEQASALPCWDAFTVLIPRKKADDVPEAVFAAQEPLREAEKARWYAGGELRPADFAALVDVVSRRVESWPG